MAPNVDRMLDMETYTAGGDFGKWKENYKKFVNWKVPRSKNGVGFECLESEQLALIQPRIEQCIEDKVPEIAVFGLNFLANSSFDQSTAYMWAPLEQYVRS